MPRNVSEDAELIPVNEELAEELDGGEVVEFEYRSDDGEDRSDTGVVVKSNKGGIRILVGEGFGRSLRVIQTTGNVLATRARGGAGKRRKQGRDGKIRRTGETEEVEYVNGDGWKRCEA